MKLNTLIGCLFILLTSVCYSQTETPQFNELDDKGKKHGYWKVLIDSNFNQVQNTKQATWYCYNLYNHGSFVYGLGEKFTSKSLYEKFSFTTKPDISDSITAIDGTLHCFLNLKSPREFITTFENGFIKEQHKIFNEDGSNWHILNYRIKYEDNPFSYFVRIITASGNEEIKEIFYYYENGKMKKESKKVNVGDNNYYKNNTF